MKEERREMTDEESHEGARRYVLEAAPGHIKMTGHDAELIHSVIRKVLEKDWPLISVYVVITVVGLFASYFSSGWSSVALSTLVAVATFYVGLHMVRDVITITKTKR